MAGARTITIQLYCLEMETGIWCDGCMLPARYCMTAARYHDDTLIGVHRVARCHTCSPYGGG